MQLINNEAKTAGEIAELEEDYETAISKAVVTFISETNVKVDLDGFSFRCREYRELSSKLFNYYVITRNENRFSLQSRTNDLS